MRIYFTTLAPATKHINPVLLEGLIFAKLRSTLCCIEYSYVCAKTLDYLSQLKEKNTKIKKSKNKSHGAEDLSYAIFDLTDRATGKILLHIDSLLNQLNIYIKNHLKIDIKIMCMIVQFICISLPHLRQHVPRKISSEKFYSGSSIASSPLSIISVVSWNNNGVLGDDAPFRKLLLFWERLHS